MKVLNARSHGEKTNMIYTKDVFYLTLIMKFYTKHYFNGVDKWVIIISKVNHSASPTDFTL